MHVTVVFLPPGQLDNFWEELDMLLNNIPEGGGPLIILGVLNMQLGTSQAVDFHALLASFDLKLGHPLAPTLIQNNCNVSATYSI